jgi:hypothetical protein
MRYLVCDLKHHIRIAGWTTSSGASLDLAEESHCAGLVPVSLDISTATALTERPLLLVQFPPMTFNRIKNNCFSDALSSPTAEFMQSHGCREA